MSGYYDIHCHLIPGVDDGAEDMEEALKLLQMEYQDGVRIIYLTPHYRRRMFECPMDRIEHQYETLKKEANKIVPDMKLYLGCEYHANMEMLELIQNGMRPTMGKSRCVLTEFSGTVELRFLQERCYTLLSNGYTPIIAHAERYSIIRKNLDVLEPLVDMGAYVQMNAESIIGKEGFFMKQFCKKAMKKGYLHFVGSDAHDTHRRKPLIGKCAEYLEKTMGEAYKNRILIENPKEIMEEGR